MTAAVIRGDAAHIPLPDESVDLVLCSPPYFGLRSYTDDGQHYPGQIGSEATPQEWLAALLACTKDWIRVLKPAGSIFVNLGDRYATRYSSNRSGGRAGLNRDDDTRGRSGQNRTGTGEKSLLGLPWRYALACTDQLGLILRRDIIWSKPNGLPESVTDRCRSSHEYVFHFTLQPRYYAAVDEIRQEHQPQSVARTRPRYDAGDSFSVGTPNTLDPAQFCNPLGALPGSVWDIPSQPLTVPECRLVWGGRTERWFPTWREGHAHMRRLARDREAWAAHRGRPSLRGEAQHFAAWPMELPRRIISGWSPPGICTACGQGRRPVIEGGGYDPAALARRGQASRRYSERTQTGSASPLLQVNLSGPEKDRYRIPHTITGYACACPAPDAPTRPAVILDPFGGTGTTALVADMLGRRGISIDRSADYSRLARWRISDPGERARAMQVPKPPPVPAGQVSLFDLDGEAS